MAGWMRTVLAGGLSIWAGSFKVNPVRIELSARRPYASVAVSNLASEPASIQVHVLLWSASGGREVYAETDDILLNPPIFALQPRQTQYMRLGLRKPRAGAIETSYRLVFEELPPPNKPSANEIRTLLRIRIPIFVKPAGILSPGLQWELLPAGDGEARLLVRNQGNVHVQITRMSLAAAAEPGPGHTENANVYVLPGGSHEWSIRDKPLLDVSQLRVEAQTDQGEIRATVRRQDR